MAFLTCNSTTICNCEDSVLTLPSGPQGIPGEKESKGYKDYREFKDLLEPMEQ